MVGSGVDIYVDPIQPHQSSRPHGPTARERVLPAPIADVTQLPGVQAFRTFRNA